MSSLYTIDQMKLVSDWFAEDGYTPEQVNMLGQNGRLRAMKEVLEERAEIKPISRPERSLAEAIIDSMVRVDRTVRPTYPSWMKEVMHPKLEAKGPTEFDSDKLEQWFHDDQKVGVVTGNTIYNHLKKHDMLPSCLGLRDLEEIQKLGITHFRRNFQGKAVFGWKSVVRSDDLNLRVPYLVEDGDRIVLHWRWLGDDWSAVNPALRFAS